MIWQCLGAKARDRGPVAFAADVAELTIATLVLGVAAASTVVFAAGALLIEGLRLVIPRCGAACAADREPCDHGGRR